MSNPEKYNVTVSDRARMMLGAHIRFLANVDKKAASEKKNEIMKALKTLSKMPHRFPFFEAQYIPPNKYHKMFILNWYIVLYQIKDNEVYVDYILDCREDYQWLI